MTDEDDTFAASLARLPLPGPSAVRLGFAAGLAAGRRRARAWQCTTVAAVGLAAIVAVRRPPAAPVLTDRVAYVRPAMPVTPEPPSPPAPVEASAMLRLRDAMLNDPSTPLPPVGGGDCGDRQPALGAWMTEPPALAD